MKKILIAALAVVILGGGAFAAKTALDQPDDPQAFVNQALANSLNIESAAFTSDMNIVFESISGTDGQITLAIDGEANKLTEYLPELNYRVALTAIGDMLGEKVSAKVAGDLIILDEVFYGKFSPIEVNGIPTMVAAGIGAANAFAEQWYSVSFKNLKELDPEIEYLFEEQKQQQLAMRESLKNFFANNDVLLVKNLPLSFGTEQEVEVALNIDILTSEAFFTELEKLVTPQMPEGAENPFAIDNNQRAEIKQAIQDILSKIKSETTLRIGKSDGILYGYDALFDIDLANFEMEDMMPEEEDVSITPPAEGKIKIAIHSDMFGVGKTQDISAPAEFTDINPLDYIPDPEEFDLEEEYPEIEAEVILE